MPTKAPAIIVTNLRERPLVFNVPHRREAVHLAARRQEGSVSERIELGPLGRGPEIEAAERRRDIAVQETD